MRQHSDDWFLNYFYVVLKIMFFSPREIFLTSSCLAFVDGEHIKNCDMMKIRVILGARICKNKACKYTKCVLTFTFQGIRWIFQTYVNLQKSDESDHYHD